MAFAPIKESTFKLQYLLSSGDNLKSGIDTQSDNNNLKSSFGNKPISEGDVNGCNDKLETNSDSCDGESAYADSFCSDDSDEESETKNTTPRSSSNKIPFEFTTPKCRLTNQSIGNLNKRFVSTSKISDDLSNTLDEKVKSLSLSDVRPTKSAQTRSNRKNMSFTNDEITKIEKDNEILLRKIMAHHRPHKVTIQPSRTRLSSSAINRRRQQRKIEEDNMMILRRLEQAKSCVLNTNKISGFRRTHL